MKKFFQNPWFHVCFLAILGGATLLGAPAAGKRPGRLPTAKTYAQTVLASRPVGYWRLDDTKGKVAADASSLHVGGQYHGSVALGQPGAFVQGGDKSVGFDGRAAYVEMPAKRRYSQPSSGRGLSVEVWFSPNLLEFKGESSDPYVYWVGKGDNGQQEWALRFYSRNSTRPNRISAYIFNRNGGLGAGGKSRRQ